MPSSPIFAAAGFANGEDERIMPDGRVNYAAMRNYGQLIPTAGPLAWVQWVHRLLAYMLAGYLVSWVVREPRRVWWVLGIVVIQIAIAATMIALAFSGGLQAAHVAVWAALVGGNL